MNFAPIQFDPEPWKMTRIKKGYYVSRDGKFRAEALSPMGWQIWRRRAGEDGPGARVDSVARRPSLLGVRAWVREQYR
jgi:hypothetical protein